MILVPNAEVGMNGGGSLGIRSSGSYGSLEEQQLLQNGVSPIQSSNSSASTQTFQGAQGERDPSPDMDLIPLMHLLHQTHNTRSKSSILSGDVDIGDGTIPTFSHGKKNTTLLKASILPFSLLVRKRAIFPDRA